MKALSDPRGEPLSVLRSHDLARDKPPDMLVATLAQDSMFPATGDRASRGRPVLVLAVVLAVVTAGCTLPFLGPDPEPDSFDATYDYSFGVDVYGNLTDVTIRAPLPVGPNGTPLHAEVLLPDGVVRDHDDQQAFDARIVETEFGPMLELTADRFEVVPRYFATVEEDGVGRQVEISADEYDPENPDHRKVDFGSASVSVTVRGEYPIDTRSPVGSEPVFHNLTARQVVDCPTPTTDGATCYAYEGPFYLSYDADPETRVQAFVSFSGDNAWFAGGWTGNGYRDHVGVEVTGAQDDWVDGEGTLLTGDGNYRD